MTCGIDNRRKEPLHSGNQSGSAFLAIRAPILGAGGDSFRDRNGDNRVRVSRDVVYT